MSELVSTRTVDTVTLEIKTLHRQAQNLVLGYAIEIGRRLVEAKGLVPYGQWGEYLKTEVEYSQSTANNFMKIFEEYGSSQSCIFGAEADSQTLGNLPYTKALALLSVPKDEREEFVQENNVEELSTRELQELLKERETLKKRTEELEEERVRISQSLEDAETGLGEAREEIRQAERELEELRSRPVDVAVETVADPEAIENARKEAIAETEARLLADKEKAEKKLEKANAAKEQAEQALKKSQELQRIAEESLLAEKAAASKAADDMKKQLLVAGNQEIVTFKLHFEQAQECLTKMFGCLSKIHAAGDVENHAKLSAAGAALLKKFGDALETGGTQ